MRKAMLLGLLSLPAILAAALSESRAGKDAAAWKALLPPEAYTELTKRSIARIEGIAKSDVTDAAEKIEAEAAILVGYTLSVKNPAEDAVATLRGAGIQAVQAARAGNLKKLADFKSTIAMAPKAPANKVMRKEYLKELQWMMENFRGKSKGGEGLHADLQYQPKLKNLNGTEAFLGAIAGKKLSAENLDKIAKELPNFAYRVAVMGSITHEFAPDKGADQWRELSLLMRDSALLLADAAATKNADNVFKSAQALENTCTKCHMVFKKN